MVFKTCILTATLLLFASLIYPGSQSGKVQSPQDRYSRECAVDSLYYVLNDTTINKVAFSLAMQGYKVLTDKGMVGKEGLLTLIDYSKPSNEERFYVVDLGSQRLLFKTLVAHGRNSGELYASRFSNRVQSHQSALGFYITGDPYTGGQGYSLIMSGVDTGFNDNARIRAIVIHGAAYVTRKYVDRYGRLGRSFGCPALPPDLNNAVIDAIKDGSVVFGYYPDGNYVNGSMILSCLQVSNSHEGT